MPTTKTTITITDLQDAAGNLLGNAWVTVRLNAGGNAVEVDGVAVAKTAKVQTDADGDASIQLYPNEAFDVEDTFYTIAVDETSPLIYRTIRVPTGGGTYAWTADAIQVEAVPFDGPYPGGTTGSAGQVVARKSSGNGFELVNHNSIAGRSTADAHPMAAVSATGLTVPKASTIVAEWEATAPAFGASSERIAAMSAVLPYVVTRDGSTAAAAAQDQHALGLLALAEAEGARSDLAITSGSAPMLRSATAFETFDEMATLIGTPSESIAAAEAVLGVLVPDAGSSQEHINDNASRLIAYLLSIAANVGTGTPVGTGLLAGLKSLSGQLPQLEGILDRWSFPCAVNDTTNLDLSGLTGPSSPGSQPTMDRGAIVLGGEKGRTRAWLNAQTNPAENGQYEIDTITGVWTLLEHPDVFDPAGNGYLVTLNAEGEADDGMTWVWLNDDVSFVGRGGSYEDDQIEGQTGRWVLWIDPTASGGGLSAGSVGTTELAADAVTFAKMQNISTARLLGRNTSGSGDVEELTAADVKTLLGALPNNLWAHQIIPWLHWKASSGTLAPTRTPSNSRLTGGYLAFNTVDTGHWVEWSVGLDAGTWDLTLIYDKLTVYGVYDVSVDGVVVGSLNANHPTSATNQVFSIPGITVPANGNHTLRLTNTADGAGANTAGLALEAIGLQRTA